MPPMKNAVSPIAACRKLEMIIEKYGCSAESVGLGYADYEPLEKSFIAVINLRGEKEDVSAFSQCVTHEEHGRINGFLVEFFVYKTLH